MLEPSGRLASLPPYPFASLREKINTLKASGVHVVSFGIGDPDMPTPLCAVDEMVRAANDVTDPDRFRYGDDMPVTDFDSEVCRFYQSYFGVTLEDNQILRTSGSKEAIVQLAGAFLNPLDLGIVPDPGYPTYEIAQHMFGANTYHMKLEPPYWLPDLGSIEGVICQKAKILWLNYPNNPTTAVAGLDFFAEAVEFAKEHKLLVVHDAAYSLVNLGNIRQPSILEVLGASEVAVEIISHSKWFNMTGWRIGAAVGNPEVLSYLKRYKGNTDNGTPRFIQFAGARVLKEYRRACEDICFVYGQRRDLVVGTLNSLGWSIEPPQATPYIWAPIPDGFSTSAEFCEHLVETAHVVLTPGSAFGAGGEGYFRMSLTYNDLEIEEGLDRIARAMKAG
ncbi:MAG: aminotransferase class I/II-fold pyridoxal phosphate-dependent enzyme [Patescibacteria group bacterium]